MVIPPRVLSRLSWVFLLLWPIFTSLWHEESFCSFQVWEHWIYLKGAWLNNRHQGTEVATEKIISTSSPFLSLTLSALFLAALPWESLDSKPPFISPLSLPCVIVLPLVRAAGKLKACFNLLQEEAEGGRMWRHKQFIAPGCRMFVFVLYGFVYAHACMHSCIHSTLVTCDFVQKPLKSACHLLWSANICVIMDLS